MTFTDEELIRASLERERPDPDDFRRSALAKLAERDAESAKLAQRETQAPIRREDPARMAQAASVAPIHLFPALLSARSIGWVAFPVVLLAAAAMTFLWSMKRVVGPRPARSSSRPHRGSFTRSSELLIKTWWRRNALAAGCTFACIAAVGWFLPVNAILLVLIGSMVYIATIIPELSRGGLATRRIVAKMTSEFLGLLLALTLLAGGLGLDAPSIQLHEPWIPATFLAGSFLCDFIGQWQYLKTRWRKLTALLPTLLVIVVTATTLWPRGLTIDEAEVIRYVESFDAPIEDVVEWQRFGRLHAMLRDLESPAAPSELALARWRAAATTLGPDSSATELTWSSVDGAARGGCLANSTWQTLAEDPITRAVLRSEGGYPEPLIYRSRVMALLREGLSNEERQRIADWLLTVRVRSVRPRPLIRFADLVEMLDQLGQPTDEAFLRQYAHRRIEMYSNARALGASNLGPTVALVRLLARFGMPDGFDVEPFRERLARLADPTIIESLTPASWTLLTVQKYRYEATAALLLLHAVAPAERRERSALEWIASERLAFGAALLVLLCLLAVTRTPTENDSIVAQR